MDERHAQLRRGKGTKRYAALFIFSAGAGRLSRYLRQPPAVIAESGGRRGQRESGDRGPGGRTPQIDFGSGVADGGVEKWTIGQRSRIPPGGAAVVGHRDEGAAHAERTAAQTFNDLRRGSGRKKD